MRIHGAMPLIDDNPHRKGHGSLVSSHTRHRYYLIKITIFNTDVLILDLTKTD